MLYIEPVPQGVKFSCIRHKSLTAFNKGMRMQNNPSECNVQHGILDWLVVTQSSFMISFMIIASRIPLLLISSRYLRY